MAWGRGWTRTLVALGVFLLTVVPLGSAPLSWAVSPDQLENAEKDPNNWLMYHGTYKAWRYSSLNQINRSNVKDLRVAWIFQGGRVEQGLESTPLVADGMLYLVGSYNRVWALDAATGKMLWYHYPELDEAVVKRQTHSPYSRGIAIGHGNVYVGTLDGHLIALDMKTGKRVWDTVLVDSKKDTIGFTGAPLVVKDKVLIGQQAGEWPIRGRIFGVQAATGRKLWEFYTVGGPEDPKAMATWGGDSWKYGGGGGWMTGSYDPQLNLVYWGTGNAAPLYDWAGPKWMTQGPRPGINLYITSALALNPDTGKLAAYHQELPHDPWDFDSAAGEFLSVDRDGKKLLVHPNKSGFVFVYDRTNMKVENVWPLIYTYNFVKGIDPKTGKLIDPFYPVDGKKEFLCPYIAGGIGWNSGAYSPKTGLYYKIGQEWCMELEIIRTKPITEPNAQLNIGANFVGKHPPTGPAYGHLDARDPVTGALKWQVNFKYIPIASLLATGGDLLFLGDAEGIVHAYDAETGGELWSFRNGSGHRGGPITYAVGGKQYVAVPSGWGSLVAGDFPVFWPETAGWSHSSALVVFTLP
ncbi:MAG TPA: PQQ-dependent dehydrogenase, methanol/ethanol family [Candidatus Methylomirabilis sp.]|nr:PQQ-dependent dehydrogenase, methanol/ethanol family [Candidatus Methylomirabilis sp.]